VLFLTREVCFPGHLPAETPFGLPLTRGQRVVSVSSAGLGRWVPNLQVRGEGTRSYALTLDNLRVATFSRGQLSERFSTSCVEAFASALQSGDRPAWFGTVTEAVVADALTVTIEWQADTSGTAHAALKERIGALQRTGALTAELDSTERTVLRVSGPLVLGYRYRPMEAVR
jgi:hypothetical protein